MKNIYFKAQKRYTVVLFLKNKVGYSVQTIMKTKKKMILMIL